MRKRTNASASTHEDRLSNPKSSQEDSKQGSSQFPSSKKIFTLCLIFRIINSLFVQTYFNPDEHWQALEVAHRVTFGYGHLTWEWSKGIRSYLHPMLFAILYKILSILHFDTPLFMIKAPRLFQSVFSAFGDLYLFKLSHVLFDGHVAQWAVSFWFDLKANRLKLPPLFVILTTCFITRSIVLGLTFLLDRLMYGSWVLVPLNFLKFNFLSSGGDYYGTHPWHWYFTQGFTVMIFTFLPFMAVGIVQSKNWKLSGLVLWVLGLYSIIGHKEFRFVLPVLPIALAFSGYSLAMLNPQYSSNKNIKKPTRTHGKTVWKIRAAVIFLVVTNLPMAIYMSMVHQRGTEDVMNYLAKEAREGNVKSILFLTPCHATPYYSTLHQNLPMRFLDCSPSEVKGNLDESDRFMMDPIGFIAEFAKNWSQPSHIILFNNEEKHLKDFLSSHSYEVRKRFFHAHFKVDRDLQESVVVYALSV
ncbi:mannosyltransferase APTG1-like [Bidens hawaiensis]|uniref:mannosyltransferase APTG1-like n=1 Tax=Bidens hawaiensis TaxID=980011 RepID=UPI0040495248